MGVPASHHTFVNGSRLCWREVGEGPALLFIHGMGGNSRNWETQYRHFASDHRVIGWDAPGFGDSDDWHTDEPTVRDYVKKIRALLDALDIEEAHLVGHSFGGVLVSAFKKASPARVLSMVLAQPVIGSGGLGQEKRLEIISAREKLLADLGVQEYAKRHVRRSVAAGAGPAVVRKGIEVTCWTRQRGYLAQWRAMARANIFNEIPKEPGTTTVVAGNGDRTASREVVSRIAAAISGARLVELPDVGHMIYLEYPERFNAVLAEHISRT